MKIFYQIFQKIFKIYFHLSKILHKYFLTAITDMSIFNLKKIKLFIIKKKNKYVLFIENTRVFIENFSSLRKRRSVY